MNVNAGRGGYEPTSGTRGGAKKKEPSSPRFKKEDPKSTKGPALGPATTALDATFFEASEENRLGQSCFAASASGKSASSEGLSRAAPAQTLCSRPPSRGR